MFRKLFFYIAIASLVASCAQGKKATASWRQKCSVNLISTVDEHNSNEQVEVLVQVSATEGAQAKLEAEGLEVSIATGNIYSGSIMLKKLPALANLPFVTRVETGSKPKLLK